MGKRIILWIGVWCGLASLSMAQYTATDVRFVFGPDKATYTTVGGAFDYAGHIVAYGGYSIRLKERGESFYFAGVKLSPSRSDLIRPHFGPLYTLTTTSVDDRWMMVAGVEFFREFVLYADVYLDPGGFERQYTAIGFRLPLIR